MKRGEFEESACLSILSSFFISRPDTKAQVMRDPESKAGGRVRSPRTPRRYSLVPRGVLLAVILLAGFVVALIQQDGSTTTEAVARAGQETDLRPVAEPTDATPDSARQAVKATDQVEGQPRDDVRSNGAPPISDVAIGKSFTVDDARAYVYTVRMGEFWSLIADRFDMTAGPLREANLELWQSRADRLQPGDQLRIPGFSADDMISPILYTVEDGDSWNTIADTFSVTFLNLLLDNFELWTQRGINIRAGDEITVTYLPPELTGSSPISESTVAPLALDPSSGASGDSKSSAEAMSNPPGTYVVQAGDTWESVAAMTGIDMLALKEVNPDFSEKALQPGDVLRISWVLHVALMIRKAERRGVRSAADLAALSEEELVALVVRGMAVYREQYCGVCHQLEGAGTRGIFGPSHGGMRSLAAARLQDPAYNGAATDVYTYLYESIIEPDIYYVEGFALSLHRMPTYRHIPEDDLEALIVFLAEQ